ncbi:hypothetical protein HD554DRAFT_2128698 [Boletus coccyginus]|nr:hypothetical protein HD554DRAFT_2128698 [Boletus coccyginus]
MACGVYYPWQSAPRFKLPLARAILDDPAFSPDPRSHPHFPLPHALSYLARPPKSPPLSPSTPTVSSALPSPVSPLSHKLLSKPPPPPHPVPKPVSAKTTARQVFKPAPTNIPRKARMKALVRRLTTRHKLDRIDELDETDPFGASYHHDGPYEAIGINLAQPTLPRINSNPGPRRANTHLSTRESDPLPFPPGQHQLPSPVLSANGETGLSLHLEPGQILQHNTIYSSHASSIAAALHQFPCQPNPNPPRPDHSRRQSLPNRRMHSPEDPSSLDLRDGFQNRKSSSLRAPRGRLLGDYAPDTLNSRPLHHDHLAAPHALHQPEKTIFPPPRYESRLHSSAPPRSPQCTPPPSFHSTESLKTQSTESAIVAFPRHDSRHTSVRSLSSSRTANSTIAQSSCNIQTQPLDPPRIRHLPKRLVMPAPLQPQYKSPPPEPPAWQDEYPDDYTLEGAHFQGKPAMYSQEPRLLRKKSSAFPAKTPIPDHAPGMSQDDAIPIMGNSSTKTVNEAEGTKERTRRRRLSKRKSDT